MKVIFITGSPRSGTTLLEYILGAHEEIAHWYEPYYIWEKYFSVRECDIWREVEVKEKIKQKILLEYRIFLEKSKKECIVDKLPTHAFNIDLVSQVFPEAKWIHMLRDGRDVTLSIKKEWEKREKIVKERKIFSLFKISMKMLSRQPFFRFKYKAIEHELVSRKGDVNLNSIFNKSRWRGYPGWGPRFAGWKEELNNRNILGFNARQWVESVKAVLESWDKIPPDNRLLIRYENLLGSPEKEIETLAQFLEVNNSHNWIEKAPVIQQNNFNKWHKEFSREEIDIIMPVLTDLLKKTGYMPA